MIKKEARKLFRERRIALEQSEKEKSDDLLLIQFQTVSLPFISTLLSYWPIGENNEPNTHLFTEFLKFRNPELRLAYPVVDFEALVLNAVSTDIDTPFGKTRFNLYEPAEGDIIPPSEIELVFVPLLIFDQEGYRVGYGRGFYDKFLALCNPDCLKIGFSYFEPIDAIEDRQDFDVPLDLGITPQAVYVF
jgi:5-formyltetrahydrofolate cyclo-ligase